MIGRLRIGLVGTGKIGSAHARTLLALPSVGELVVADVDPTRAREVADSLGATVAEPDTIMREVDAVVITTSTATHAEVLTAAARAGVPTFCEKPVALDVATTREVLRVVEESGTPVQIGFQRRFDVGYAEARRAVRAGELGEVRRVHMVTCDPTPPPAEYVPTSGGIFKDCGIHDMDILRWVTGAEVVKVSAYGIARGDAYFAEFGDCSEAAAAMALDDGTVATLQLSRYNGQGYDVRMEVAGNEGAIDVGLDDNSALRSAEPGVSFPAGESYTWYYPRFQPAYAAELATFVRVASGEISSPATVADALEALYVCEAMKLSHQQQRPVEVAELREP